MAADFQTAYENAGLPQNGQAVTYGIMFLLSALTDITTVFVLLFVSVLLIIVSFICLRFTIMATLEEEIREIGTMKAIGMPFVDIRNLYLYKYRFLSLAAVFTGYILALLLSRAFIEHISTAFGKGSLSVLALLGSLATGGLVLLLIDFYCQRILQKLKKVTVVDALVTGKGFEKRQRGIRDSLNKATKLPVNWLISVREIFYKFKNWFVVFGVVLIAVMMTMIPVNLLNTFKAPQFITYMGSSLEDILIEVENGENLEKGYASVKQLLEKDDAIEYYHEYRSVRAQAFDEDHKLMNLNIDSGANAGKELQFLRRKDN